MSTLSTTNLKNPSSASNNIVLDSSGRVLVGTSTARTYSVIPAIQLEGINAAGSAMSISRISTNSTGGSFILAKARGSTATPLVVASNDTAGTISFEAFDGTNFVQTAEITAAVDGTPGTNDMPGRLVFSTTADGASSPTERMRITNGGDLLVRTTTVPSPGGVASQTFIASNSSNSGGWTGTFQSTGASNNRGVVVSYSGATPNDGFNEAFFFTDATAVRFSVKSNGGINNYSANNTNLSDINTKKDISLAADTWECVKEWEIVNYRYKDQPDDADLNLGVIAQQVAESCPEVITVFSEAKEATEDSPAQEERLGVKEQQMYWMAIKALQEAQVRIETLEAKVAALESA